MKLKLKLHTRDPLQFTGHVSRALSSVSANLILPFSFSGFRSLPDPDLRVDGDEAGASCALQPHGARKADRPSAARDTTGGILHPFWTR